MKGGECGVLSPLGNPRRLADEVAKLLSDTSRKDEMISRAYAHVVDCFSGEEHREQSETLLRGVLESTF
jgi:glycosyltransferase involved in cell wall biosynthesis